MFWSEAVAIMACGVIRLSMSRSKTLEAVFSSFMSLYEVTSVGFEDGDNGAVFNTFNEHICAC